jgi:hypothetical protein
MVSNYAPVTTVYFAMTLPSELWASLTSACCRVIKNNNNLEKNLRESLFLFNSKYLPPVHICVCVCICVYVYRV